MQTNPLGRLLRFRRRHPSLPKASAFSRRKTPLLTANDSDPRGNPEDFSRFGQSVLTTANVAGGIGKLVTEAPVDLKLVLVTHSISVVPPIL
ncbi:hypothetical protein HPP92_004511 [Vanilla planifolia]|uniref:Uncharacterized protein n=1 Tax=Vanilla planifolia TaxID=51239 RepID=A0A835VBL9_VANPL|nr:hypothetical protein HPP92_004896 [Vanilla planifolia]KAG0493517.1 hypothetical protein HPP92_004511 [Vanilla planifolia]